jgi:hypothetical protein
MRIPRQRELGTFIGGLKLLFQRTMIYFSIYNFVMIFVMGYYTTIRHIIPWLPFTVFFLCPLVIQAVLMIIDYVYVYPSEVRFMAHHRYLRDPLAEDVREIKRDIKEIKEALRWK